MADDRLTRQIAFLSEADKLKTILRRTPIGDGSRAENSAEHSWHLVVAAMTLSEYAPPALDRLRVIEMLAVHDIVEIDAGDTFAYDAAGYETKVARELAAAERIFELLPQDQAGHFRACWEEFEAHQTLESKYANALDRFQALLQNLAAGGGSWQLHRITRADVLRRMAPVQADLPQLWPFVLSVIDRFCETGALAEK
jgi:putative hydrolases of HD superfamily